MLKKKIDSKTLLIALCWLVYSCSYIAKLGYNANITQIENVYKVSHSTAGMVSTFFFFAYGVGQVINGIFCKKYNIKYVVFFSLIISGLMNLLIGVIDNFNIVKYLWLINGASLSVLWTSLIRLLSENLEEKYVGRAVVIMGTTVATGTLCVYGLSSLFVALGNYVITFILAGVLLPSISLLWLFSYPKLVKGKEVEEVVVETAIKKRAEMKGLWIPIIILAFFAVANNVVKDGLTTWVPMILKETYSLPDYVSILLTMLLPILAIFGASVAVAVQKKIKDFVLLAATFYFVSSVLIGLVILCLPTGLFGITLGSFAVVACLMSSINSIVTGMVPLFWKEKINSGLLAGVLNGFCYLGSTLSAYGLGAVADFGGWNMVFWLLFALSLLNVVIGVIFTIFNKKKIK